MSRAPTLPSLYLRHSSFSTLPLLHLRHSSFSNPSFASHTSQSSFSNLSVTSPKSQLILQPFRCFTNVTAHSSTLPLLRHSSFSNPSFASHTSQSSFSNLSVTSPTSQLILQPFRRFTYVTAHSSTLPLFHLRHSSFSNPSFASLMSQALHLIHLASRPSLRVSFEHHNNPKPYAFVYGQQ